MLVGSFLKEMSVSKWTRFMSYEKRAVKTSNKTWITRRIMKSLLLSVRVNITQFFVNVHSRVV